jgi:pimeloyl-ACP methyl ester carboxylesterase
VVFLQHGLEGSAADWVTNLPNQGLAFVLADAGYDVWLGNFRGNKYGRQHTTLSPSEHSFWSFSWDEMARYDLPAMIDLALNVSKSDKLYYVGFSLGTTTAFAKFSQDREFAKKIKKFYAIAPMATVKNIKGPLAWMAKFTGPLQALFKIVGMDEFAPNQWLMNLFAKYFCAAPVSDLVCKNLLFLIGGPESDQLNTTRLPVYLAHSPSGTSTRTMIHMGQMVKHGKFQAYDFGSKKENQQHYHQDQPFEYDLSEMEVPVGLYSGGKDWLSDPKDVQILIGQLKNVADHVYLDDFNDFDFIWGLRASSEVYYPIRNDIRLDSTSGH